MKIGTKEHYDLLNAFDKNYKHKRLDKEPKEFWLKGRVYQNGEVNDLYRAFFLGYTLGRCNYME